jgi:beta-phosphoglucomutase-like phosphatase (HAD superfamily)
MTFDAAIFDLDGTLLDTEAITQEAARRAFAACGIAVDGAFLHAMVGVDDATTMLRIRALWPALDLVRFEREWSAATITAQAGGIPLKPGVADLLARLTLPRAIATSSTRAQADRKLAHSALPAFAHVIVVDDVARPKPAPDPYLLAAARLGANPARCVAFEDSDTGAAAARAAGMVVVQVPDVQPTDGRHAHHLAPDLMTGARMAGLIAG